MIDQLQQILDDRKKKDRFRKLTVVDPNSADFSSNDFLSMGKFHPFRQLVQQKVDDFCLHHTSSLGSGGSRLLDGNSKLYEALETQIAHFHGADAGLIFNSGFDANSGFFSCVPQPQDVIIYDELIHASVHEGMKMCRAKKRLFFKHNCVDDLQRVLSEVADEPGNVFVAVEAVYSMDGDTAPLREIHEIITKTRPALLVVDEAHATGVVGTQGKGLVSSLGMEDVVFARIITFGKALSANGAIVLCHPTVRSYLVNYARSFIFTTALGHVNLLIIQATYELLASGQIAQLQDQLWDNLHRFSNGLNGTSGVHVYPPQPRSAIFSVFCSNPRSLAQYCQQSGLIVRPIVHPTVPKGTERVRVCIHSGNTAAEVDLLIQKIKDWHSSIEVRGRL